MTTTRIYQHISLIALTLILTACGGSSGSSGGTSATGANKGVITALGSIFVNGIEYSTTGSSVSDDGLSGTESGLRVGMVVTVKGTQSDALHGAALSVDYRDNLEGPVDVAPDLINNRFQALGQTIAVNTTAATVAAGKTVFHNFNSLADLTAGTVVEVSGLPDANGIIQATYIESNGVLQAGAGIEVKGTIASLNTTAKTFNIGALTIDYTTANLSDLPAGGIADGLFVEVKGTGAGYTMGAQPVLVATKVENEIEEVSGIEGKDMSVEGYTKGFTGAPTFEVSGQPVNTGSLSLAGIANNVKVEVEGYLQNGVLVATKIELR